MNSQKPNYDFDKEIFKKNGLYRRLAKEHISLSELESDFIKYEVVKTRGSEKVPVVYHVHYYLKSIVGIDKDQNPLYDDHHIVEVTLPLRYPLEPAKIYMVSEAWHPNIKSEGKFKGRICGNTRDFGKNYNLYLLALRIGEILQYKNYHAEHTPPYPEDAKVAEWALKYAEPNDIFNKEKGIYVDDRALVGSGVAEKSEESLVEKPVHEVIETTPPKEEVKKPTKQEEIVPKEEEIPTLKRDKIRIVSARKAPPKPKTSIRISKK